MALPSSVYPVSQFGLPVEQTKVRPFQQPLYDHEIYDQERTMWLRDIWRMWFFKNCIGDKFSMHDDVKTRVDTNWEGGVLNYTAILINVVVVGALNEAEREEFRNGIVEFKVGNTVALETPIHQLRCFINEDVAKDRLNEFLNYEALKEFTSIPNEETRSKIIKGYIERQKRLAEGGVKISVGKNGWKLNDGFSLCLVFNRPPAISRPIRIGAMIHGFVFKEIT